HQGAPLGEALLQRAQEAAGLGRGDGDPRHHDALQKKLPFVGGEVRLVRHRLTPQLDSWFALVRFAASTAGSAPAVDDRGLQSQAVSNASFARRASIVGFNSSATPGVASTLSNSWFSGGISGVTIPATHFPLSRC